MEYLSILLSIFFVNLLLSGDNALVIALASRQLSGRQRRKAVVWGGAGAISLRVLLTLGAVAILNVPYVQLVGGLLLLWIAIKLVVDNEERPGAIRASDNLPDAVKTILVADLVMSLDNVIAIAGVSKGNIMMLIIGLALSIPVILWGSSLITLFMERWPVIIVLGAVFLGWTSGEMLMADSSIISLVKDYPPVTWMVPGFFAVAVFFADLMKKRRKMGI